MADTQKTSKSSKQTKTTTSKTSKSKASPVTVAAPEASPEPSVVIPAPQVSRARCRRRG